MLPYLKKFQTFHMPDEEVQKALGLNYVQLENQGVDGPIHTSYSNIGDLEIDKIWIDTFRNMGYEMKADTMSGHSLGGYQIASVIEPTKRERSHAGVTYWEEARHRSNLTTMTDAVVDKVLFDSDRKATGVKILKDGSTTKINAAKEVILASGVIGSPGILKRSGRGEKDRLEGLGIDVVVENSNVGKNLQDHLMAAVSYEVKENIDTLDSFRDPKCIQEAVAKYNTDRSGPLGAGAASFAYMPLLDQDDNSSNSELSELLDRYLPDKTASPAEVFTKRILKDRREASANLCLIKSQVHLCHMDAHNAFGLSDPGNYISLLTALAHPLSRGSVHISSQNPDQPPMFDPAYYSHPLDIELMSRHITVFERIVKSSPLAEVIKPGGRKIPDWVDMSSDEGRKRLLKASSFSNHHPCGTAMMAPRELGGVVDERLCVYGTKGLRVVDASIFPVISRGNIMSVVYTVAEKAVDMIKEDINCA